MKMKEGFSPQQACKEALRMIVGKYRKVNPGFYPSGKCVAVNRNSEPGCATMKGKYKPLMSVCSRDGDRRYEGTTAFPEMK